MSFGRITNQMVTEQVLANINSAQNQLDLTQEQLSSGKVINEPSDNPYGATQVASLNDQLSQLTGYSDQVSDGTAWMTAAGSALSGIESNVQRIQELVTEAANGTNSSTDLSNINDEITQLTAQIKQDANAQYNGQYVFSGSATTTAPWSSTSDVYQGNSGMVTRTIGPGTSVQVNANLNSVLGSGQSAGDGKLLDTLATISNDLSGTGGGSSANLGSDLSALSANQSALEQVQATVGSTQDRLELASTRISSLQTSTTATLSGVQDANYATTMTSFTNEQAAFQAALQASANIVQTNLMQFLQ